MLTEFDVSAVTAPGLFSIEYPEPELELVEVRPMARPGIAFSLGYVFEADSSGVQLSCGLRGAWREFRWATVAKDELFSASSFFKDEYSHAGEVRTSQWKLSVPIQIWVDLPGALKFVFAIEPGFRQPLVSSFIKGETTTTTTRYTLDYEVESVTTERSRFSRRLRTDERGRPSLVLGAGLRKKVHCGLLVGLHAAVPLELLGTGPKGGLPFEATFQIAYLLRTSVTTSSR